MHCICDLINKSRFVNWIIKPELWLLARWLGFVFRQRGFSFFIPFCSIWLLGNWRKREGIHGILLFVFFHHFFGQFCFQTKGVFIFYALLLRLVVRKLKEKIKDKWNLVICLFHYFFRQFCFWVKTIFVFHFL